MNECDEVFLQRYEESPLSIAFSCSTKACLLANLGAKSASDDEFVQATAWTGG